MYGKNWTVIASIVIAALLVGGAWYYNSFAPAEPQGAVKPPYDRSKLVGKQTFQISQGERLSPKFKEITIDKLDVKPGDVQKFEAVMQPGQTIESVTVMTETDTTEVWVVLAPIAEDPNVYRGEWTVHDTTDTVYHSTFRARGGGRENAVTLAWSDPCTPPMSGDWTIDANCTSPVTVTGADAGDINFSGAYTLTIPSSYVVAFNSGKQISLGASGIIALSGEIKKTNLWVLDADVDLYSDSATAQTAQDSSPGANYYRRNTRTATTDCCDSDANAKPGQTTYFTTARSGCGGYDYNCSSTDDKFYTGSGTSCTAGCCNLASNPCASGTKYYGSGNNGNSVACGSAVTVKTDGSCGGGTCTTSNPTQSCR